MDKESVLELLGDGGPELEVLKQNSDIVADFVKLIEAIDKLKAMDRRIQEKGLSLYQAISKGRNIQDLEGVLEKFFGKPVKPAGEKVAAELQRTHTYKHFKTIQEAQSLFIRKVGNTELYGVLLPWPNKENTITVHLGVSNPQMPEHEYQKLAHVVHHRLIQKIQLQVDSSMGGQVQGVSLISFLQMSEMEGTSAVVRVKSGDKAGTLYLENGQLVNAETQELKHLEAAHEIVAWDTPTLEIENATELSERHIQVPLMQILMESMKLKDGRELSQAASPGPGKKEQAAFSAAEGGNAGPSGEKPFAGQTGMKELGDIVPLEIHEKQSEEAIEGAKEAEKKASAQEEDLVDLSLVEPSAEDKKIQKKPAQGKIQRPTVRYRQRRQKAVVAAAVVVIVALGAFFGYRFFTREPQQTAYEKLLARLAQTSQWEAKEKLLMDFIDRHEAGEDTAKAEKKLQEIWVEAEDAAYKNTIDQVFNLPMNRSYEKNAAALYEKFLAKYPSSRYRSDIEKSMARIYELSDDFDFSQLRNIEPQQYIERLQACQGYLEKHPNGSHRKAAMAMIQEAINSSYQDFVKKIKQCESAKSWSDCIRLCDEYMSGFRTYIDMDPVRRVKRTLEARRDYDVLLSTVSNVDDEDARKHYLAYLDQYPDAEKKDQILAAVETIEQRQKEAEAWAAIKREVQGSQLNVEEKMDKLQNYIWQKPNEAYLQKARELLRQLGSKDAQADQRRTLTARTEDSRSKADETAQLQQKALLRMQQEKARIEKEKQRLIELLRQGGRFVLSGNDVVTDQRTGLMWSLPDSYLEQRRCMDYRTAVQYVKTLGYGGYSDWRLPTSGELAGIYKNSPFFPADGAGWYWSSESFAKGYHDEANIVTSKQETVYKKQSVSTRECGHVRAVRP